MTKLLIKYFLNVYHTYYMRTASCLYKQHWFKPDDVPPKPQHKATPVSMGTVVGNSTMHCKQALCTHICLLILT